MSENILRRQIEDVLIDFATNQQKNLYPTQGVTENGLRIQEGHVIMNGDGVQINTDHLGSATDRLMQIIADAI